MILDTAGCSIGTAGRSRCSIGTAGCGITTVKDGYMLGTAGYMVILGGTARYIQIYTAGYMVGGTVGFMFGTDRYMVVAHCLLESAQSPGLGILGLGTRGLGLDNF